MFIDNFFDKVNKFFCWSLTDSCNKLQKYFFIKKKLIIFTKIN